MTACWVNKRFHSRRPGNRSFWEEQSLAGKSPCQSQVPRGDRRDVVVTRPKHQGGTRVAKRALMQLPGGGGQCLCAPQVPPRPFVPHQPRAGGIIQPGNGVWSRFCARGSPVLCWVLGAPLGHSCCASSQCSSRSLTGNTNTIQAQPWG